MCVIVEIKKESIRGWMPTLKKYLESPRKQKKVLKKCPEILIFKSMVLIMLDQFILNVERTNWSLFIFICVTYVTFAETENCISHSAQMGIFVKLLLPFTLFCHLLYFAIHSILSFILPLSFLTWMF